MSDSLLKVDLRRTFSSNVYGYGVQKLKEIRIGLLGIKICSGNLLKMNLGQNGAIVCPTNEKCQNDKHINSFDYLVFK